MMLTTLRILYKSLLDAGAEIIQNIKNVGGERLIASVKDKDGNIIGLVQN